jgi:hypothetical protein
MPRNSPRAENFRAGRQWYRLNVLPCRTACVGRAAVDESLAQPVVELSNVRLKLVRVDAPRLDCAALHEHRLHECLVRRAVGDLIRVLDT